MKQYVLVKNQMEWIRFFTIKWQAYQYMWNLKSLLKPNYHSLKAYSRNGRLFVKSQAFSESSIISDVYEIWEISYADGLNYMLAEGKASFIRDWIINGSEYTKEE